MNAIFQLIPKDARLPFDYDSDFNKYLLEKEGVKQLVTLKDYASSSEKERLYAYLFGPVMKCAVDGFTASGESGIDKVKARYVLEAMFCKAESYNSKTGKVTIYTESVSAMGIKRLHKFISDVLFFLESELQQKVPDAEAFKMRLKSGRDYESINKRNDG